MTTPLRDAEIWSAIDTKTKPVGALGRLEALAAQIARTQNTLVPRAETCRLLLFAADHGLASAGVSAYPQAVTQQMLANFLQGGAASTAFARALGVTVGVIDAGVAGPPLAHPELIDRRLGAGTANALDGPAMTADQVAAGLEAGRALGAQAQADALAGHFVYAHRSAETGHGRVLAALGAEPLLALDMRLGEGTGALLAWPLVKAAAALLSDMASFDSAGVSGPSEPRS
ncbi:MAG: nicotinate-nucleotide--dimethylbenzimidazole phosphoribosyltransferase [Maricaulaceae bacterium]